MSIVSAISVVISYWCIALMMKVIAKLCLCVPVRMRKFLMSEAWEHEGARSAL